MNTQRTLFFNPFIAIVMMILITWGVILQGCAKQQMLDTTKLVVTVSTFEDQYNKVTNQVRLKQTTDHIFNDEEWRKLLNVDASINMIILKAKAILTLSNIDVDSEDIDLMYKLAKESYKEAYEVIAKHWGEFSTETQLLLTNLNNEAKEVDGQIQKMLEDPTTANIVQTVTLIAGIASVTLKMIALFAT